MDKIIFSLHEENGYATYAQHPETGEWCHIGGGSTVTEAQHAAHELAKKLHAGMTWVTRLRNKDKAKLAVGTELVQTVKIKVQGYTAGRVEVRKTRWVVTGKRKAKNGLRLRIRNENGTGAMDVDFEHAEDEWGFYTWETAWLPSNL